MEASQVRDEVDWLFACAECGKEVSMPANFEPQKECRAMVPANRAAWEIEVGLPANGDQVECGSRRWIRIGAQTRLF